MVDALKQKHTADVRQLKLRIQELEAMYKESNLKLMEALREKAELLRQLQSREPLRPKLVPTNQNNIFSMLQTTSAKKESADTRIDTRPVEMSSDECIGSQGETSDLLPTQFTVGEGDKEQDSSDRELFILSQGQNTPHKATTRRGSINLSDKVELVKQEPSDSYDMVKKEDVEETQFPVSSPAKPEDIQQSLFSDDEVKDSYEGSLDYALSLPTPQTNSKIATPLNVKYRDNTKFQIHQLDTPSEPRHPKRTSGALNLSRHPQKNREWIIEDFKVNPEKNDNSKYAYHVVVRGAKRRCIHGKTCKDCDKFYKSMGDLSNIDKGPRWNNAAQADEDEFEIVKTTSRHRDLWDKPESPPGFGQFDFPSTLERLKHKERAQQMKQRMAYERLHSTLNDKRWLFKDASFNEAVSKGKFIVDRNVFLKYLKQDENE